MNLGKYVFAQICTFLPARLFDRCVEKYQGNKWVRHFSCYNQLLFMIFGQLSGRESLRDLLVTLDAHKSKFYHLGLGKGVSRSNLAEVNERRDYRIYEDFAYEMIHLARQTITDDKDFKAAFKEKVYALDSTTIDLCLNVFWWASFRKNKGAVKLHTLYEVNTAIPSFVFLSHGRFHDVRALDELQLEAGAYYIMDKAYLDFERLYRIDQERAFFVTRAKINFSFNRLYSACVDKSKGIMCDQTVTLKGFRSQKAYPDKLRRIKYYDLELGRSFVFITNNFELPATEIALLYKHRWSVELFFRWIKQHLKVKAFWGTSFNAVKTQVYIAIITYTLVAIIRIELGIKRSNYEILQILSASLFDKTQLHGLLQPIVS
ncbi:IS4 family transposase [Paraflavisolibacter sp. H34]|uniref:IS4 family transposase n=1 Tax=Huijunlia imazamoxiresistens TaxID=3127457 RepID=UPI003016157E